MNSIKQVAVGVGAFLTFFILGCSNGAIVETANGQVEGIVESSRLGEPFHAFYSIPYAEPPVGDLRFKPPVPVANWTGIRQATAFGNQCVQVNARPDIAMDEDCLVLNVFSRNLTASVPVIFYIHGAGFQYGSSYEQGGPEYFMDRGEVVIVSMNYRLGSLGFLATGTSDAPGNAAMKDQVLALKWVQTNIASFGGDRNRVTLTGMSAGSIAATSHLVSPMSVGLFHRLIGMSTAITLARPLSTHHLDIAQRVGRALNCTADNVTELVTCLRTKAPLDIMSVPFSDRQNCNGLLSMPVIEPDFGQERFFTADPIALFASGNFSKVPVITGRTSDEFIEFVPRILNNADDLRELNENFEVLGPRCFVYEAETSTSKALSKALRDSYLPLDTIDVRSFNALSNLFSDGIVGFPVHRLVHLISNFTEVYYYKFTYAGRFSNFYYPRPGVPYGVHHVDDLWYVFYRNRFNSSLGPIQPSDPENFMVEHMTRIWESFAHTGNPNYDAEKFNWPKHNTSTEFYLDIGTHLVEKNGLFLERYSVWEKALASSATKKSFSKLLVAFVAGVLMWRR